MNTEIECFFIKLTNDSPPPREITDENDFGVKKIQIFASRDIVIKARQSMCISTDLALKCQISPTFINQFHGVLEMFLTLDASTTFQHFNSDSLIHRIVLLTPKVSSISLEIEIPHFYNFSDTDLTINRLDSIGFIQFVIRGIPELINPPKLTVSSSSSICNKCEKKFSSSSNLSKHLKRKHASNEK